MDDTLTYLTKRGIKLGVIPNTKDIRRVTAKLGVNVRSAPSITAGIVGALAYDTRVEVFDTYAGWCQIAQGWVSSSWLESV